MLAHELTDKNQNVEQFNGNATKLNAEMRVVIRNDSMLFKAPWQDINLR